MKEPAYARADGRPVEKRSALLGDAGESQRNHREDPALEAGELLRSLGSPRARERMSFIDAQAPTSRRRSRARGGASSAIRPRTGRTRELIRKKLQAGTRLQGDVNRPLRLRRGELAHRRGIPRRTEVLAQPPAEDQSIQLLRRGEKALTDRAGVALFKLTAPSASSSVDEASTLPTPSASASRAPDVGQTRSLITHNDQPWSRQPVVGVPSPPSVSRIDRVEIEGPPWHGRKQGRDTIPG